MTQFNEGQEVEVWSGIDIELLWRRAKIKGMHGDKYFVKFADGTYADFDAEDIRPSLAERDPSGSAA